MLGFAMPKTCGCGATFYAAPRQWKCHACLEKSRQRKVWAQRRAQRANQRPAVVDRSYMDDADLYRQHLRGELD